MKHTPGPWKVNVSQRETVSSVGLLIRPVDNSEAIAFTLGYSSQECIANAKLIASAPELKEALEGLVVYIETYHNTVDVSGYLDAAYKALNKSK